MPGLVERTDHELLKAFVDVRDEAAAATAVVMAEKGPPTFRADHPFLYMIRDNETGSILFMGRLVNPEAKK
jgi:serpin B